jgi:hypothetical protein
MILGINEHHYGIKSPPLALVVIISLSPQFKNNGSCISRKVQHVILHLHLRKQENVDIQFEHIQF